MFKAYTVLGKRQALHRSIYRPLLCMIWIGVLYIMVKKKPVTLVLFLPLYCRYCLVKLSIIISKQFQIKFQVLFIVFNQSCKSQLILSFCLSSLLTFTFLLFIQIFLFNVPSFSLRASNNNIIYPLLYFSFFCCPQANH